jgi:hypothetical protein
LIGKLEGDIQRFGGIFKVKKETTKQCIFLKLTLMPQKGQRSCIQQGESL